MRQFRTIFKFEFANYGKNKAFIVVTLLLMVGIAVVLSWPRIDALISKPSASEEPSKAAVVAWADSDGAYSGAAGGSMRAALSKELNVTFEKAAADEAALSQAVQEGKYERAIIVTAPNAYTDIVKNTGLYDNFEQALNSAFKGAYRAHQLAALGIAEADIADVNTAEIKQTTVQLESGKDQSQNFLYTYILIFVLYMAVILYGQFVASSVATEKSTRAMELLITSTKPQNLMFGKVFGAGAAGIAQMVLVFGTAYAFYNINSASYTDNAIIRSVFGMPIEILLYMVLFFVLGFFIYAFLYGASGSLVSRMEELSAAIMPVTMIFIVAFVLVMSNLGAGSVDSPLMVLLSFVPLTSPMAMFVRISMGNPAGWEIAVSVGILVVSTALIGFGATAVYRMGVLLYGKPPRPGEVIKMLRGQRKRAS